MRTQSGFESDIRLQEVMSMPATKPPAAERSMQSSIAAHTAHAIHGSQRMTQAARQAANFDRFADEIDPDRRLPPIELERRVAHLRQAHMKRLALRSARVRRERAAVAQRRRNK